MVFRWTEILYKFFLKAADEGEKGEQAVLLRCFITLKEMHKNYLDSSIGHRIYVQIWN